MQALIPPPPPVVNGRTRPIAFFDTECYPNYWLLKLRPRGGLAYSFRLHAGHHFGPQQRGDIMRMLDAYTIVSFNGNGYDIPMITGALTGYTCEDLKALNDRIIIENLKPWELNLQEWKPGDHIDIMEVAPGAGSQKQYAGRIHCKTMRDLPYNPSCALTETQILEVDAYCENDLDVLTALFDALRPQVLQREKLSERYGIDLRSKSDAQLAEAVLRKRCEQALGKRIYKPEIDFGLQFKYKVPTFIAYQLPQLQRALQLVEQSTFRLGPKGTVEDPPQLDGLEITIGQSTYKVGIGGLHSQEKKTSHLSDAAHVIRDNDVASYYPSLILNSGEWPPALGSVFLREYEAIKNERLASKALQASLKKSGDTSSKEYENALVGNEGGKIMINGTFGKTGSPYSVLFAPSMLIQTTLTGQLSLLMLIEWHEFYGIPVISANTDGMVIRCPRDKIYISEFLISEWQKRTGLEMETVEYVGVFSRDVNNYFATKPDGSIKRKGEYSQAGLIEKKNPDVEICADAVAEFLAKGTPIIQTIVGCSDIRKFVTVQRVNGGAVKMWGEGPRKGALVRDMTPTLEAGGWIKDGRKWRKENCLLDPTSAYKACFAPQTPEYLGKVARWYYSTQAPGSIVYATNGNTVSLSYGARPCMTLPDELPIDIDYAWYIEKAKSVLQDIGYHKLSIA